MVFIHYEEFVKGSYFDVEAWKAEEEKKKFSTGDVVKDFSDAMEYLHDNGLPTVASSTVDNFLMDNNGDFDFDQESFLIYKRE